MGSPVQVNNGGYRDSLGGLHEIAVHSYTDSFGRQAISGGGIYNSKGQPYSYENTGYLSGVAYRPGSSSSGVSSILSGTGGGGTGAAKTPIPTASDLYSSAIDTARTGVQSAKDAAGRVQDRITNSSADLAAARAATGAMSDSITNINNTAAALSPYAAQILGQGNSLQSLYDQLISGDTSRGGMGADYLNSVKLAGDALLKINPDEYVSAAASDAQSSTQNAYAQSARELARRGVNVNSGAYAALQGQRDRAMATALAAAKTAARRQGIADQAAALTQRAGLYQGVVQQAQSVGQQATNDIAAAAGIVQKQGDLFATAGSLSAQQANSYADIGGVEVNLGQLDLQSESAVQNAIANVAAAQQAMAQFYKDTMTQTTTTDKWGYKDDVTQTTTYR